MNITYDPNKNQRNIAERGLSFDEVMDLDWQQGIINIDDRKLYPEVRYVMTAPRQTTGRLHVVCFSQTADGIRVISFRKANKREIKDYEQP